MRKIVEEEMAPYHATHRQRVITEGPAVVLLPASLPSDNLLARRRGQYVLTPADVSATELLARV